MCAPQRWPRPSGAGRPYRTFVYVTVGTGISHRLVQDGRSYAGAHGNALVLASAPLSISCSAAASKFIACWKRPPRDRRSSPATTRAGAGTRRRARGAGRGGGGREAARTVVHAAGAALGNSVGFLVNVLDPEAVIVGGGWLGRRSLLEGVRANGARISGTTAARHADPPGVLGGRRRAYRGGRDRATARALMRHMDKESQWRASRPVRARPRARQRGLSTRIGAARLRR